MENTHFHQKIIMYYTWGEEINLRIVHVHFQIMIIVFSYYSFTFGLFAILSVNMTTLETY